MPTFNPSLFRWPFLCILVCLAGCSSPPPVPAPPLTVEATPIPPAAPAVSAPALAAPAQQAEGSAQPAVSAPTQQAAGSSTAVCRAGYVRIAPGTFTMGSPSAEEGRKSDETQHSVTITRAFCMKTTEVTQGEWQAEAGANPSRFQNCGANCPVENVTWDDAVWYANALSRREGLPACYAGSTFTGLDCRGYRLPTEAEWEYAARAGTTAATYGNLDSVAWYDQNAGETTHPVRQKEPNAWGLYDMLGNVWEWTGDWFGEYSRAVTDPTGPATGHAWVFRGGSWYHLAPNARAAFRNGRKPGLRSSNIGFRLVLTAP